jgi:para-aminobenzoate synthetase component 1
MKIARFPYPNSPEDLWQRALQWTRQYRHVMITENHRIPFPSGGFQQIIMAGNRKDPVTGSLGQLKASRQEHQGWLAGYISYDLKNSLEELKSENPAFIKSEDLYFFYPEHVLIFHDGSV